MVFVEDTKGQPIAGAGNSARRNNRLDPSGKGNAGSRAVTPASEEAANPAEMRPAADRKPLAGAPLVEVDREEAAGHQPHQGELLRKRELPGNDRAKKS